jgi:class 3 adenylate cyclase/tetratricopeptide (TPR) repeat protein
MTFDELLAQVLDLLQREGRVSYRALKRRFDLDDDDLEDLKDEIIAAKQLASDEQGRVLVWTGGPTVPQATARLPKTETLPDTSYAQAAQSVPSVATPHVPEAERRQLTVLFCDLVDSTRLARTFDPEDWRDIVRGYQQTCAEVIQRFDGYIAQYLGDGLLMYFGYPQAHEDDAQRAGLAGLGILDALESLNARLEQGRGVRLAVRVGVHTGPVVVDTMGGGNRQETLALGDTPNIAARLQGLAAPNTVVVSAATLGLIEGFFTAQALGAPPLKGVEEPLQVYQLLAASEAQTRLDIVTPRGLTPLVGREQEVGLLLERWAQSMEGHGQVVLLSGEAGIGKSRLVEVLRERVGREGATWLTFRCSPYHRNSALYPVITHLQRVLHVRPQETPAAHLEKLEHALQATSLPLEEAVPLLAALLSIPLAERYAPLDWSPHKQKQKTYETLVAWLVAEAERQPVLAVWEDLHWADPSTLEWLALVIDQTPTTPLYTLLTYRPEFPPPWAPRSYLSQLTLNHLPRPQIEAMLQRLTGGKRLPAEVVRQLVAKTDGVPLFVEELTKTVLEAGWLQEQEDHYELTGPLPTLAIPTTLQDALRARLDRLPDGKAVAQLGAVLGRTFSYELLRAVSPLDELALWRGLVQLVKAEVLYQRGMPPQATYMFKHALLQEAAYQSLLRSTRQQYHQRTAQVLAERFPDLAETQPELLAHHYTEASLNAQAVVYWQRAGQSAHGRAAFPEAMGHLTTGLEVLKTLPDTPARMQQELNLLLLLAEAVNYAKGQASSDFEHVYAQAYTLCQRLGDPPQLVRVLHGFRQVYGARGEFQRAREYGEQALALAQRRQDPALLADAHYALGVPLYNLGEITLARAHFEQGMPFADALAQPRRSRVGVLYRTFVAVNLWYLGYPDQAVRRSHEALTLAQSSNPYTWYWAQHMAGQLHRLRREVHVAYERFEAALALASEQGLVQWLPSCLHQCGWALAAQGQYEAGMAKMRQGIAALQTIGVKMGLPGLLVRLAEACGNSGQAEEGLRLLAEALAVMDNTGERILETELYRIKGMLLLQQTVPDAPQAEACFQQALAVARRQQTKSWELRAAISLSRLWQRQGKRDAARELLAPIYDWFTEGFDTADLQEAKALLEALS